MGKRNRYINIKKAISRKIEPISAIIAKYYDYYDGDTSGIPTINEPEPPANPDTYIVMAAIRDDKSGKVYTMEYTSCHTDIYLKYNLDKPTSTEGFIDNHDSFHNRREAGEIAYNAGQCNKYFRNHLISTAIDFIIPK